MSDEIRKDFQTKNDIITKENKQVRVDYQMFRWGPLLVKTNEQIQQPTKNKDIFKSSDLEKMSDAEFERNEKSILMAQREGRITKD